MLEAQRARRSGSLCREELRYLCSSRKKIIAVVDDDPSMLGAAGNLLEAHGFVVKAFASAEEFLDRGAAGPVDYLLLDIDLGGMSGIELRRQLKASGSELPVIFMTALDDEAVRAEAQKTGCVAFLRKPFLACHLFDAIEKAVPKAGAVCGSTGCRGAA